MDTALVSLIAASTAFVGTHFALSHPLRGTLVRLFGSGGFMALYSVVAAACMVWMYFAFTNVTSGGLGGSGAIGWIIATALTLPALVLFLGSLRGNPASPAPGAEKFAERDPGGVYLVTRHPMMWGFTLWAASHIILWWSWRTNIVALSILVLALVGSRMQDRKKEVLMGEAWQHWEARTSYWPRWSNLPKAGVGLWVAGIAVWLLISWSHIHAGGIPAGAWRWIG